MDIESMTDFEQSELILHTLSTIIDQLSLFLTVLFAYFAAAYLVGKKLSRIQLYSLTFVYSFFSMLGIATVLDLMINLNEIQEVIGSRGLPWFLPGLGCFMGWVLSIVFMVHSRRSSDT